MDDTKASSQPQAETGKRRTGVSSVRARHDALPTGAVVAVLLLAAAAVLTLWLYRNSVPAQPAASRFPLNDNLLYAGVMGMFQRPEFGRIMFQVEGTGLEEEELIRRRSAQSLPPVSSPEKSRQEWARLDQENRDAVYSAQTALKILADLSPGQEFYTQVAIALDCANRLRDNGRLLTENESAPAWLGLVYINAADGLSRALAEFLKKTEARSGASEASRRSAALALKKFSAGLEISISAAASEPAPKR